jgi:hypothetical protein
MEPHHHHRSATHQDRQWLVLVLGISIVILVVEVVGGVLDIDHPTFQLETPEHVRREVRADRVRL